VRAKLPAVKAHSEGTDMVCVRRKLRRLTETYARL